MKAKSLLHVILAMFFFFVGNVFAFDEQARGSNQDLFTEDLIEPQGSEGPDNTYYGDGAGGSIVGKYNAFFGLYAGFNNKDGDNNVYVGTEAGHTGSTGSNNVFVGFQAGYYTGLNNEDGDNNVYVGTEAGHYANTGSNNVFIGFQAGYDEVGSDKLHISNSKDRLSLIYGDFKDKLVQINGVLLANKASKWEPLHLFLGRM